MRGLRQLALALALLTGCGDGALGPGTYRHALPEGAVPFAAPAGYAQLWAEVEQCSGQRRPAGYPAVEWYVVPDAILFWYDNRELAGVYLYPWAIVLADLVTDLPDIVRHEMLHAVLPPSLREHPVEFFRDRCGAIVAPPQKYD